MIQAQLPSGASVEVLHLDEAHYLERLTAGYQSAFSLEHISDITDLDRVVQMEVMIHRWQAWLLSGTDYDANEQNPELLQRRIDGTSKEVRLLKKALNIDAVGRERSKGEGSVPYRWEQLLERAKAFMIMRDKQFERGLVLSHQLSALVTHHDNSTEKEQKMFHTTPEGILDWIRTVYVPEFNEIDQHFRERGEGNVPGQRFWIREQ